MIAPGAGVRVYLACGRTDTRNYAEPVIMRSPRRRLPRRHGFRPTSLHIIFRATRVLQHRQEFVGSSEAAPFERRRRNCGKRFELFGRIGTQIDFRALESGMAEPKRDFPNVPGRLQRMHRTGVAQNMGCDALFGDRWLLARRHRNALGQDVLEAGARHRAASGVEEQLRIAAVGTDREPRLEDGRRFLPQRQHTLASPFSHDVDAG